MDAAGERLFFALLPPPEARAALARAVAALRAADALRGRWLDPRKWHVTLPFLGSFAALPPELIARAADAAATVRLAPFALAFDRLESFRRHGRAPCVLLARAACVPALVQLFDTLAAALALHDVPFEHGRDYVPHLTLAYGELAGARVLDAPVGWQAERFALLRSRVAQGVHETLATWPLRA